MSSALALTSKPTFWFRLRRVGMMCGERMHRVFVYGTLRSGGAQSARMEGARCLGAGWVRGDLFRVSWYPGVVLREDGGKVVGEVYEAADDLLDRLDEYEGGEYRRVRVRVEGEAEGEAWMWEWAGDVPEGGMIAGGDWLAAGF